MTLGEYVTAAIDATVDYTRSSERIRTAKTMVGAALPPLKDMLETDGELAPEVMAACEALVDADAALDRAFKFVSARYDETMKRINAEPNDLTPDPTS